MTNNVIDITIRSSSPINTSILNKITNNDAVRLMRSNEYVKIMLALPVGRENAMTAKEIASIAGTTSAMVPIAVREGPTILNPHFISASSGNRIFNKGMKSDIDYIERRWIEIDKNGNPTGAIKTESKRMTVYWVESKITLDDFYY